MAERPVEQPSGDRRADDERDDFKADRVADAFEEGAVLELHGVLTLQLFDVSWT